MPDIGHEFPEGTVVREFRFGQFVLLSQTEANGQSYPIVLTGESSKSLTASIDSTVVAKYGGVPLEWLYQYDNAVEAATGRAQHVAVEISDIHGLLSTATATLPSGEVLNLLLDTTAVSSLSNGKPATVWGTKSGSRTLQSVTITPAMKTLSLTKEIVETGRAESANILLSPEQLRFISASGQDTVVPIRLENGGVGLLRLMPRRMVVLKDELNPRDTSTGGDAIGDGPADPVNPPKNPVPPMTPAVVATSLGIWMPGGFVMATLAAPSTPATSVPVSSKPGVRVAALLPWVQKWTLTGHTKGSLVGTLPLAPGEETTIRISSWVRSRKSLDQQSDLEVDQAMESNSTQRDTEEVMRELTSKHDFSWDVHGSLDAVYNFGSGSVSLSVGGSVNSSDSLEQNLKTTAQHMREATQRSSLRVASRRSTRITEERESYSGSDVVRTVRNPNLSRTLTLNYREVLANYTVSTSFDNERVQLVALVPNPLGSVTWDLLTIRTFEHTLFISLLEPSLADAFEAVRKLVSYDNAKTILANRRVDAKKVSDAVAPGLPATSPPPNPHAARVLDYLGKLKTAATGLGGSDAAFGAFATAIANHETPSNNAVASARKWVFKQVLASFGYGSLLTQLQSLKGTAEAVGEADLVLAGVPEQPDGRKPLGSLAALTDKEVEDAGLHYQWTQQQGYIFWDDGFWRDACKAYAIYSPMDGGIVALIDGLRSAWRDYQAKNTELATATAMSNATNTAEQGQTARSDEDILEMKFGLEEVASAQERVEALMSHLRFNDAYYRYAVFQSLPPGVQLDYITQAAPQLKVGSFEPRVISMCGSYLCVPLVPIAASSPLGTTIADIVRPLAAYATDQHPQSLTLPTPGVAVEAWLGVETALEPEALAIRQAEALARQGEAAITQAEARRMSDRLTAKELGEPGGYAIRQPNATPE